MARTESGGAGFPRSPLFQLSPTGRRSPARTAFTLIELLLALALIGALVALSLNVAGAAQRHAAAQHARAELAVLATSLASYRRHFGEYPRFDDVARLWSALTGRLGPNGMSTASRSFVDSGAFRLMEDASAGGDMVIDPWGHAYRYRYFGPVSSNREYALYSIGPDGRDAPPDADGAIDLTHVDNLDNVYADRD